MQLMQNCANRTRAIREHSVGRGCWCASRGRISCSLASGAQAMTLFVFSATATMARIITSQFRHRSSVGFRRGMVMMIVVMVMVAIRTVYMRLLCLGLGT